MNRTILVHRNPAAGYSIYRCFKAFKKELDIDEIFVPEHHITIKNIIKNIIYIRKNTDKSDIIHITGDIHYVLLGLIGRKTILTIHDTVLLDNCKNKLKWIFYYLFWFYFPCKIAKKVICISEETARCLNKYIKCNVQVIPDPISSDFEKNEKEFNTNCPSILHIGTGWNKNIDNVIKALSGLNIKLIIIGEINNNTKELLNISNLNYVVKKGLSDSEIINEYINSDIISFPSIYEGFGLPILEGQSIGRVVITSNIEPHKAVAGCNGAILVDPFSITSIRDGFLLAINNKTIRDEIILNGYKNVQNYSEPKIIELYKETYKSL